VRVLALWLSLCVPAVCAAGDGTTIGWTEIRQLLDDHPAAAMAAARSDAAAGELLAAHAIPNPEVEASLGRATSHDGTASATVASVGAGLTLPWPGLIAARVRGAGASLDAARAEGRLQRRQLWLTTRALYWSVARDQQATALLQQAQAEGEQLLQMVQLRVAQGEDAPLAELRASTEQQRTRMKAERAARQAELHRQALDRWLGDALPDDYRIAETLPGAREVVPSEQIRGLALAAHPAIEVAGAEAEAARAGLLQARSEVVPALTVGGEWETELDLRATRALLGFEIPLLAPGAGEIARARAEAEAARQQQQLVRREAELELDEALTDLATASDAASAYEGGIVPDATAAAEALTIAYRAGGVALMDVMDARRVLLEVQIEQVDALLQLQLATERIEALTGGYDAQ
jgi:cobalt-zinc-cadmium efflux system outer membrane protein